MKSAPGLRTERLILRPWREEDLEPFAALNADPEVMAHFPNALDRPNVLDRAECDALVAWFGEHFAAHGFGPWAVEAPGVAPFIGFVGLLVVEPPLPFAPAVEALWRLARVHWGKGYAVEAAAAAIRFAKINILGLDVIAFTVPANIRSIAVMERLGMVRGEGFAHPKLPEGDPLRRHVLYRLPRDGIKA